VQCNIRGVGTDVSLIGWGKQIGICNDESREFLSLFIAIIICPFGIAVVVAFTAWWKGESSIVWNYRADWSTPVDLADQVWLDGQKKEVISDAVANMGRTAGTGGIVPGSEGGRFAGESRGDLL
jgi:hypothetical protein